jgi:signal transduction histidine kinase
MSGKNVTRKIIGVKEKFLFMIFPLYKEPNKQNLIKMGLSNNKAKIIGGIVIQAPLDNIRTTINDIIRLIFYASIIALITALFLSIIFSRKITKPLAELRNAALKISDGEFYKVMPPKNSSREIKQLIKTFNYSSRQIKDHLDKKERLEKMRNEYVANISHEFRAPLTSIKGFLELILEKKVSQKEIENYSKIMYKDTEYLEHLVDDLLTLGRLESEDISLNRENVSIQFLVNRAVNSLKNKFKGKNVEVNIGIDNKTPILYVDKYKIHQVIINILENAISYSPQGETISINVKNNKNSKKNVEISIRDNGPGIPQGSLAKIWQRFYKEDNARTRKDKKGSGLGLAIVKKIVEKHGGEVKVTNNLDKGSTFTFILYENSLV